MLILLPKLWWWPWHWLKVNKQMAHTWWFNNPHYYPQYLKVIPKYSKVFSKGDGWHLTKCHRPGLQNNRVAIIIVARHTSWWKCGFLITTVSWCFPLITSNCEVCWLSLIKADSHAWNIILPYSAIQWTVLHWIATNNAAPLCVLLC